MLSFSKKKAHLLLGRNGEIERARVKEIEREREFDPPNLLII
jgi:hypothetical protein